MRKWLSVVSVLAVAGCAHYEPPVDRTGVTDAQYKADREACQQYAVDKMRNSSFAQRWDAGGLGLIGDTVRPKDESNPVTTEGARHNIDECMKAKGYKFLSPQAGAQ